MRIGPDASTNPLKARRYKIFLTFIVVGILLVFLVSAVYADEPVVHAVLFYSPYCSHCQIVREQVLPDVEAAYRESFNLLEIDTSTEDIDLYYAALDAFQIPPERQGVPMMIIDDLILVGSHEIPERLPGIIEEILDSGGNEWPPIPEIKAYITEKPSKTVDTITVSPTHTEPAVAAEIVKPTKTPLPLPTLVSSASGTDGQVLDHFASRFRRDILGNSLAAVLLFGMILVFINGMSRVVHPQDNRHIWPEWVIPALSLVGIIVASYLSFVEITQSEAVCGPVGDCNTVQQSPYANLFGFLPVGVFGLLGYILILVVWFLQFVSRGRLKYYIWQVLWLQTFFGLTFSIYLTFLEPFVIGATCAWCLSSAVIITIQFLAATSMVEKLWAEDVVSYGATDG